MWKRRTIAIAVAAGAAGVALAWAFAPRPLEVEVAPVGSGRFEQSIEEDGRSRWRDRYAISAPVTARLARVALREGDEVRAGDTLAVLSPVMPAMVDERSLREATARLQAAEAAVGGAAARVDRTRIGLEEARLELQRTEKLAREGFLAPSRLDSARLALDAARRELEAAQAARDVAGHERAQAAAIVQPAGRPAADRPLALRAPIAGTVLKVPVQSEATVAAGTVVMEIGDPARMEVVAELLTADAMAARPGTRAVVERWGGPAIEGRVRRVEPAAFTKVSALGVEEQRVNVVIDLVQPPEAWRRVGDGFRVTVRLVTASADVAVQVPVGAIVPAAGGGYGAYVIEGGRAVLRRIELAGRNGTAGWVRAGLSAGEQVIVYPPPGVAGGRRVRPRPAG
jgi:HlyD family secretion protein